MNTDFVLDAPGQALRARNDLDGLNRHSAGARNICRFATVNGLQTAVSSHRLGSTGDSYDNALAESINGPYKADSSIVAGPGAMSTQPNSQPWNG